jgi:uncharacterized membrane protein
MELLVWCSSWCDYSISHPINVAHCWSVDVCDYSIYDPCDAATQLMFRLTRLLDSCYIRTYFGAINKIPVILECTLVLSMRFLLYSNILWCYQWDSCYTRMYFGAINEIPVILECTLVLSMRFLLYSNVLWCYQWDSCYTRRYFGVINEIPVILECTLVLSMRFLLYSRVLLWCYQCVILYEKAASKKLDISGNRFSIWKRLWQGNSVPIN